MNSRYSENVSFLQEFQIVLNELIASELVYSKSFEEAVKVIMHCQLLKNKDLKELVKSNKKNYALKELTDLIESMNQSSNSIHSYLSNEVNSSISTQSKKKLELSSLFHSFVTVQSTYRKQFKRNMQLIESLKLDLPQETRLMVNLLNLLIHK